MNEEKAKKWSELIITAGLDVSTGDIKKIEVAIDMLPRIAKLLQEDLDEVNSKQKLLEVEE